MSFSSTVERSPESRIENDTESDSTRRTSMVISKGAAFRDSTSTFSSTSDDVVLPPRLVWTRSHLDDVVDANRRRIALTLNDIDEVLAKTASLSLSSPTISKSSLIRERSPAVPRAFLDLPVVDPSMAKPQSERRLSLRTRSARPSRHASDSGLGSSIASIEEEKKDMTLQTKEKPSLKPYGVTSVVNGAPNAQQLHPALSRRAFDLIHEHTIRPLLEKPSLKEFETLVVDVPRRIRSKEIRCLRDLEKTLIFMAPETAKSAASYLDFCLTTIRCVQATVEYLPEHEQVRSDDRPYTHGYFIDLKEQICQYGMQLAAARGQSGAADEMDMNKDDKIRLFGGIAENGRPAELVRIRKDGTAVSLATGKLVDLGRSPVQFKRSLSEQRDDEEEVMRSMARRRKNATAEELAPKRCREPGCDKEFKRPCDLTKHEKTHSRPWKCPVISCPYHRTGWPTEKERDRHTNDKHSDAPILHKCEQCVFKSKRMSNLKQHMERAHNTPYVRTKTNGKKGLGKSGPPTQMQFQEQFQEQSQQQTPLLDSISPPTSTSSYSVPTPPVDHDSLLFTNYQTEEDLFATCGNVLDPTMLTLEDISPSSSSSSPYAQYPPYQDGSSFIVSSDEELYAASMRLPPQLLPHDPIYQSKPMHLGLPFYQAGMPRSVPVSEAPAHFYPPTGQENAMFFASQSFRAVDEGIGGIFQEDGQDFQLYPAGNDKGSMQIIQQSLFEDDANTSLAFAQTSQPEFYEQLGWMASQVHSFSQE
ncbi:hypothetical protein E4U56_005268 [Claviceps arundinis]|uniref:C2H2-type domain-containing protein n=1 Tax=Claviceps arundinis TaxID=1623583 RepID=A0A9P7SML8_9HYPO|nr:hypothetical protein E4U56_005268 [Claviceps arundinis]